LLASLSDRYQIISRPIARDDASHLDRLADAELQHGHVAIAERLAHLAAQLRETRAGNATSAAP
jgi:hypothetical protein